MAGEVTIRASLARPYMAAAATPQVAYLLLEVTPGQVMTQVRAPVNVCFVIDRSGSMKGDKIDRARRATIRAIEMLDHQDVASVVIFDHRCEVLIPAAPVTDHHELADRISRVRDGGGTRIAPAVELGLRELEKHARADTQHTPSHMVRRLVLLTDGQTENEADCLRRAQEAGQRNIPITALGIGKDWNEDLLIEMANRSGGTADYIDRPEKIVDYFQSTIQRAQATTVQNASLTLRLVQGVLPRAVWQVYPLINNLGYRPISDRDVNVPLGELETGSGRTLLVEVLVEPRPAGEYRLAQAEVSYDIPLLNLHGEKTRADIMLTFTNDAALFGQVNAGVMNIVEKVSAFKLQTRALQDLAAGDIAGATQKLQSAVTRLLNQGEVDLAQTMQREIQHLQQTGKLSSEGQKTIKFGVQKTVRLSDIKPEE